MSLFRKYKFPNLTTMKRVKKQMQERLFNDGLTVANNLSFDSLEPRFLKKYGEEELLKLIKETKIAYKTKNHKIPEIGTKEFNDLASKYFGGKPKQKSSRKLAIEWWYTLNDGYKNHLMFKHRTIGWLHRNVNELTDSEIEKIYVKETTDLEEIADSMRNPNQKQLIGNASIGTNDKQLKEFNPELFKAYISKFSEEDKLVALRVLYKSFPDSPLKNHISKWFE